MKIDLSFVPQELQYALTELLAEMNLKTKRSFTLKTIHSNFCSVSFSDNELTIHYEEKNLIPSIQKILPYRRMSVYPKTISTAICDYDRPFEKCS